MISSQLESQTISRRFVISLMAELGKTFDGHRVRFDAWHIGLWTNYGIISWHDVAAQLRSEAENRVSAYASPLNVIRKGQNLFLVESCQDWSQYHAVLKIGKNFACDCMKFKCWKNRLVKECPQLFQALDQQIFCHHTVAVEQYLVNFREVA